MQMRAARTDRRRGRRITGNRPAGEVSRPSPGDCLVTAVDGAGRGAIGLSASRDAERITALFLCDVERGVLARSARSRRSRPRRADSCCEVPGSGGDLESRAQGNSPWVCLPASSVLSGPSVPEPVSHWLERDAREWIRAPGLNGPRPPSRARRLPREPDLLLRADEVLEACPTWLDSSALTFELAEEIALREGQVAVDPRPRFRGVSFSVRAPDHPPAGALPEDAPLDEPVLGIQRRARPRQVGAGPCRDSFRTSSSPYRPIPSRWPSRPGA